MGEWPALVDAGAGYVGRKRIGPKVTGAACGGSVGAVCAPDRAGCLSGEAAGSSVKLAEFGVLPTPNWHAQPEKHDPKYGFDTFLMAFA